MKEIRSKLKNIIISNEKNVYWKIPFIVIFFIGVIGFIVTSFSDWDDAVVGWGWNLQQNHFIKGFACYYFNIGTNQLTVLLPLCITILFETILLKKNKSEHWTIYLFYTILFLFWIAYHTYFLLSSYFLDDGWGSGIYVEMLLDAKTRFYGIIAITIINTIIFLAMLYFIHYKLIKRPTFLLDRYWYRCMFILTFCIITYFIVIVLKESMGRPEYLFTHFEEVVGKITWATDPTTGAKTAVDIKLSPYIYKIPGVTDYQQLKINILAQINNNKWAPTKYYHWWEINGNWSDNIKFWAVINWFTNPEQKTMATGWNVINFPSGHMNATFTLFGYGYVFIYENMNIKRRWKIGFMCLWLAHLLGMFLMLIISTLHYPTDCFFTLMLCPTMVYPAFKITDFIIITHNKNSQKRLKRKEALIESES